MQKNEIRAAMRRLRKGVSPAARAAASQDICEQLLADDLGSSVAVYLASPDELDLTLFIEESLRRGVRLFAPRWTGEAYELAELRGLSPDFLRVGPHGILEPPPPGPVPAEMGPVPTETGSVPRAWIVPGLAFTREGGRLGYGGGWYDRMLAEAASDAQIIGVAYPFQIVDELPTEPHDVHLSRVVSVCKN
jgi:5-formyltetrahydrofolate cyclo-ligase